MVPEPDDDFVLFAGDAVYAIAGGFYMHRSFIIKVSNKDAVVDVVVIVTLLSRHHRRTIMMITMTLASARVTTTDDENGGVVHVIFYTYSCYVISYLFCILRVLFFSSLSLSSVKNDQKQFRV